MGQASFAQGEGVRVVVGAQRGSWSVSATSWSGVRASVALVPPLAG